MVGGEEARTAAQAAEAERARCSAEAAQEAKAELAQLKAKTE